MISRPFCPQDHPQRSRRRLGGFDAHKALARAHCPTAGATGGILLEPFALAPRSVQRRLSPRRHRPTVHMQQQISDKERASKSRSH
ncbi:hypothetical protein pneo_cds_149 [Pandoravirus neocaledonia]|uniref:Uncharacterized protein n=1 Tax=Pandoravirus neocaledonia TaxID=2107708 RepID=A0A2U7UBE6_9VIRU|nr:hypothetical protein pneo_cds_149 [Pandoravirus neocaledonia]AVK75756.1 hypothetical protein pneo_cds_149 [Pandoravirus neocaledonia]